ncbi:MAG: hypothetical protein ABSH35_24185 [Isosphaeraceae bacterium]|jgi:hypothetical protein
MASQIRTSRSPSAKVGKRGWPVQPEPMKQDRSVVFSHDLHRLGRLLTPGAGKRLCPADRLLALGVKGREVGIHLLDVQSGDELGQIHGRCDPSFISLH